jgi:hypothetical protein
MQKFDVQLKCVNGMVPPARTTTFVSIPDSAIDMFATVLALSLFDAKNLNERHVSSNHLPSDLGLSKASNGRKAYLDRNACCNTVIPRHPTIQLI